MPFISYAQNFEDVLLWRALGRVERGFFIDVGAHHPDHDSVTRAFVDRGWRGINIEPLPAEAALLRSARPRDVTLQVAVGAEAGRMPFHVVAGTGLSTLDASVASAHAEGRFEVRTGTVEVLTLADICALHAEPDIHFLKIDVEGAERAVLQGADFDRFRPWIVLAEATAPGSTLETHAGWEQLLLDADYEFVWFDGLNRFYLAAERAETLRRFFDAPPNVFDDFVRATDNNWIARFDRAESEARQLRDGLRSAQDGLRDSAERERRHAEEAGHEINRLRETLAKHGAALALAEQRGATAEHLSALQHRDAEALRAALHEARHELQQTHLRLQATERDRDDALHAVRHELQHTHLRLQAAERTGVARLGRALLRPRASAARVLRPVLDRVRGEPSAPAVLDRPDPAPATHIPDAAPVSGVVPTSSAPPGDAAPEDRDADDVASAGLAPADPSSRNSRGANAVDPTAGIADAALPITPPPPFVVAGGDAGGLRTVHQFHSGSAVGDAITNALLMVRGMLRGMGYASEIFVEQPPPALAHELRTLEELPRHDDYVLLMHHSMGYDRFDEVLSLPAPKLLVYHNITPPALLARHPHMARYAVLGRAQLARFRGRVAASLAISDYNGNELRQLGLAPVRSCNLLFDIDALRRRAADAAPMAAALRQDGVFTILFVGRINESKNQAGLIDAFAAFRRLHSGRSRLVLVGRADGPDDPYLALLRRRIGAAGLEQQVLLTGGVSDRELDGWYGAADLYVSLSRHEGFGVPLVEAMVHGVPVLAFGAGAVPHTLGGVATLVPDPAPHKVARQMLALAENRPARDRQRDAQSASLARFALPLQARVLQHALLRAGAALPETPPDATGLENMLRFSVTGHVNGSYSLAAINRDLALALEQARPGHVRLLPVEGAPTLDLSGVPGEQAAPIRTLALRPPHETGPEMVISQHYPVLVPREGPDLAVALLFWEESRLPADTVSLLGRHFDAVVAPTRFVREVLIDSGLPIPVRVIPPALRLQRFASLRAARAAAPPSPVHRFLHVSSCFPRKGVDVLLRAWAAAFRAGDPVSLVIKGFPNPHNEVASQLDALLARDPAIAPVTLLDRDLDEDALLALYASADTMVLPTRGEGLNLPAAEALAAGLGLIVTGAGGHMDFCLWPAADRAERGRDAQGLGEQDQGGQDQGEHHRPLDGVRLLRFRSAPSGSHLATPHSSWLEPDEADLASALRERVASPPSRIEPPQTATPERIADAYAGLAAELMRARPRRPARISWVSSWGVRCGVAEYSRHMLAALERDADASELRVRVLADRRTPVNPDDADVAWPCWNVGDDRTLAPLAAAIAADDADAVMLQHQPGLLSFALLADLLAHPSLRGRVLMATLHNTVDLLELDPPLLARVLQALRGLDRVLVHTAADAERLRALGVPDRVTLLAHGVPPALPPRPVRALGAEDLSPRIGCYGFFLPGKGIDVLIEATALLRRRWPGAELRLVNAEYDADVSAQEIARCRALAEQLGIADAVSFETGFLPNRLSLDRLGACDVVALAYRPSKEASSAALRGAMAAGVAVAVTPISLFEEAGAAAFRFDGLDAATIAAGLDCLLDDGSLRASLQDAAQRWMSERQWGSVARQVAGMAVGLVRTAGLA